MQDPEYKRLKRFIILSWALLLVVLVALAFWGSYQIKNLKHQVKVIPLIMGPAGLTGSDGEVGHAGLQGPRGDTGAMGPAGLQGTPGPQGVAGPEGPQGEPGQQGDPGTPGRVLLVRENPTTGGLECKFSAFSSIWLPISECQ